ncbi:hypothetical protein CPB84DRAFT_1824826 [Gymnopilus junonius]|uniref:Uncharacterized protein n=1 Tax=Gymnopilus junonius TaxID=109634 RepID=A0A9P5TM99_GYMJU|nr:hypothetical protein CPB84DRAFT_1824826 [Gymnopilus junonius]
MPEALSVAILGVTITAAKAGYDITVPAVKNTFNHHLNGRSLTKEGGRYMDETIDILSDPNLSGDMVPSIRQRCLEDHERLQPTRQGLVKSTSTLTGSVLHSAEAKRFHLEAKELHNETKVASDSARVRKQLNSLSPKTSELPRCQEEVRLGDIQGDPREVEIQAHAKRPLQRTEEEVQDGPSQEFELKIVDAQNHVHAQGQPASHKRGDPGPATSEAEARLRAILSPGGKTF